jgi:CarD family transcriptional regulator
VTKARVPGKAEAANVKTLKSRAAAAPVTKKAVAEDTKAVATSLKSAARPVSASPKAAVPPAKMVSAQSKPAMPESPAVTVKKSAANGVDMPAADKSAAVTLNKTAPKVTTAVSSSASLAESVAAGLKKAAEKTMAGKAAKPPLTQNTDSSVAETRQGQTSTIVKTPEIKAAAKPVAAKPVGGGRQGFKAAEFIVYPAHGVGQIITIEEQEVAGFKLELFVISFIKDKMILKVPTTKAVSVGMRKLAENDVVKKALETLTGRARIKRTMWSRRAQEYEAKINSGDLGAIAEVVRDLYRSDAQPEQSYSERQLYEAALDRLSREVGTVQKLTETESLKLIEGQLQKGPRRNKAEESDSEVEADSPETDEGDIEEAA